MSSEISGAGSLTKAFSLLTVFGCRRRIVKDLPFLHKEAHPHRLLVGLVLVLYQYHPSAQTIKTFKMPPNQTLVYENEDTELVPSYEKKGKELSKKIVYKRRTRKRRWA